MQDQVIVNKRKSWSLVAGFAAVTALVVAGVLLLAGVGGLVAVGVAVLVAAAVTLAAYRKADAVALRLSRAQSASDDEHQRYHNLVEGLCVASGLPKPELYVIDDPAPNAFAVGHSPRHGAVAVTTGLLDTFTRIELEGVLAHELSRIRNHETRCSTLAVTMVGPVVALGDLCVRAGWWGMGRTTHEDFDRSHQGRSGGLDAVLRGLGLGILTVASPVTAAVMRRVVTDRRETLADMSAVEITRYPPGLIAALEKLGQESTVVASTSGATEHLWLGEPLALTPDEGRMARVNRWFATHPPIEDRISLLREL